MISIIICTLALLMAVRLENVREYKKDIKTVKELSEEFFANQRRGFELICKSKKLRWFIAYSAVISFALVSIMQTYQLYFSARGIPVQDVYGAFAYADAYSITHGIPGRNIDCDNYHSQDNYWYLSICDERIYE